MKLAQRVYGAHWVMGGGIPTHYAAWVKPLFV
jgi:hypothetical protein